MSTVTDPVRTPSRKRNARRIAGAWLRELAIVVVGALLISTLLRLFIVQMFVIPSVSMENTLLVQDRVAVQKVAPFQRGDVVVFRDTLGWLKAATEEDPLEKALVFVGLAPDRSVNHLIKRVIGVAGDHVICCDAQARLTVNGTAIDETAYLYTDPATGEQVAASAFDFDLVVPKGTVFVLGDHRNASADSRCHLADDTGGGPPGSMAFVPTANIVGAAFAVVYPFSRLREITRPRTFENLPVGQVPPEAPRLKGPLVTC